MGLTIVEMFNQGSSSLIKFVFMLHIIVLFRGIDVETSPTMVSDGEHVPLLLCDLPVVVVFLFPFVESIPFMYQVVQDTASLEDSSDIFHFVQTKFVLQDGKSFLQDTKRTFNIFPDAFNVATPLLGITSGELMFVRGD